MPETIPLEEKLKEQEIFRLKKKKVKGIQSCQQTFGGLSHDRWIRHIPRAPEVYMRSKCVTMLH